MCTLIINGSLIRCAITAEEMVGVVFSKEKRVRRNNRTNDKENNLVEKTIPFFSGEAEKVFLDKKRKGHLNRRTGRSNGMQVEKFFLNMSAGFRGGKPRKYDIPRATIRKFIFVWPQPAKTPKGGKDVM